MRRPYANSVPISSTLTLLYVGAEKVGSNTRTTVAIVSDRDIVIDLAAGEWSRNPILQRGLAVSLRIAKSYKIELEAV